MDSLANRWVRLYKVAHEGSYVAGDRTGQFGRFDAIFCGSNGTGMNILFVTSTRIGDAVLSTGLLAHLMSQFPDARITVACGVLPAPLFATAPGVVSVIELSKQSFARHWFGLWARVVATIWDLVVDLRGSGLAWTLLARRRRVFRRATGGIHRVEALGRLFDQEPPPAPKLWISSEQATAAAQLITAGGPVLGVGPTANWGAKIWPPDNFAALLERLTARQGILPGARIAVFGGPDERTLAQPLLASLPAQRVIDLVGTVDLPTAAACLERCALFIGNDSGLMHIAAATGTPTLGLFGPSPSAHYAPWGPHCAVALTDIPYEDLVGGPEFDHRNTKTLMSTLSVDKAASEAETLWRRLSDAAV